MLQILITVAFAADIPVGPGESIAGAAAGAGDGDVVVVEQGADTGGIIMASGVSFTIRSATAERVDIPALRLDSATITLQHVRVLVTDRGAYTQAMAAYQSTVLGEDVEFSEKVVRADMGALLDGSTFDVTGLRVDGFSAPILYLESPSAIRLADAVITGNSAPVAIVNDSTVDTPLEIEGGQFTDNPSQYGLFLYQGAGAVRISDATFTGNGIGSGDASVLFVGKGPSNVEITRAVVCGNTEPAVEIGEVGDVLVHRSWFSGEGAYALKMTTQGPMTVTHTTFTGAGLTALREVDFTNDIFLSVDPAGAVTGTTSHVGWFGTDAADWLTPDSIFGVGPGFVAEFDAGACDVLPRLAEGSVAIDAGDPKLPREDGDQGLPDLGPYPWLDEGDTDGVVTTDDWLIGGGGCANAPGGALSMGLALLALRRRRAC